MVDMLKAAVPAASVPRKLRREARRAFWSCIVNSFGEKVKELSGASYKK